MALLDSEVQRIRYELGYHVLTANVEPYITYVSLFDQVIQPYVEAGASTTSSTSVSAATTPTPVTLTLSSATGFTANARVAVDVDSRQELATIQSVSGADITVILEKAHSGTYPVTVEGGEVIVRELLSRIADTKAELAKTFGEGALKKVDEIEFYKTGGSLFDSNGKVLSFWRRELASALGIVSAWDIRAESARRVSVY